MSFVQLTSSPRRWLRTQLRRATDASSYRRLLAILELERGLTVAEVAASLPMTRQSVSNWARSFAACPDPAVLQDHYGNWTCTTAARTPVRAERPLAV
jgi:Homeodomain-like domain-containing protein